MKSYLDNVVGAKKNNRRGFRRKWKKRKNHVKSFFFPKMEWRKGAVTEKRFKFKRL